MNAFLWRQELGQEDWKSFVQMAVPKDIVVWIPSEQRRRTETIDWGATDHCKVAKDSAYARGICGIKWKIDWVRPKFNSPAVVLTRASEEANFV